MTKTDLQQLEHVGRILESLIESDSNNPTKPLSYRRALIEAQDHYSMLLTVTDNHKEAVLDHNFWNDELAAFVNDGQLDKETVYEARYEREENGDYTLLLDVTFGVEESDKEYPFEFENYVMDEDLFADVNLLFSMGYKVSFKK